jgi:hypothetical protein
MNPNRLRLMNAVRKALFQRRKVQRAAETAQANFAPTALKRRATREVIRRVDDTASAAEGVLRTYALPLGAAALAGLAFAFRRPLGHAATILAAQANDAADVLAEQYRHYRDNMSAPHDQETEE